jgi:hypothetical protein
MGLANGMAALVIGSEMAGSLYKVQAHTPDPNGGPDWCSGTVLAFVTFVWCALLCG